MNERALKDMVERVASSIREIGPNDLGLRAYLGGLLGGLWDDAYAAGLEAGRLKERMRALVREDAS